MDSNMLDVPRVIREGTQTLTVEYLNEYPESLTSASPVIDLEPVELELWIEMISESRRKFAAVGGSVFPFEGFRPAGLPMGLCSFQIPADHLFDQLFEGIVGLPS